MKTRRNLKRISFFLAVPFFILSIQACQTGAKDDEKEKANMSEKKAEEEKEDYIEVVTNVMDFQMKDTLRSGWQTFHYLNKSEEPHFFLLDKYPEGKTIDDGRSEVIPVFQAGMNLINEGRMEEAMSEFGKLPEWFSEVVFLGGTGLISPGKTAVTTLDLQPGYYVMECYVKKAGVFHSTMGMVKELIVSRDKSGNSAPDANVNIHISGEKGITYTDSIEKGHNVFAVTYDDQKLHEHFVGHDVHLLKLEENYDLNELLLWMNWSVPGGLSSPGPDNVIFLGGVNDLPEGNTGYFTADLKPGKYALMAEVPDAATKNMFKVFHVNE